MGARRVRSCASLAGMRSAAILLGLVVLTGCSAGQQLALTRAQDATIHIDTSTSTLCWTGAIGRATRQGCGDAEFAVHDQTGLFSSTVQKKDATGATVTISIIVNGREVASNSTSADYGVALVIAPLP